MGMLNFLLIAGLTIIMYVILFALIEMLFFTKYPQRDNKTIYMCLIVFVIDLVLMIIFY